MVGMARRAVLARVVAGGTEIRETPAIKGVAPLHAARTSQRDVPTGPNRYRQEERELISGGHALRPLERPPQIPA